MNFNNEEFIWDRLKRTKKPIIMYGTGNGAEKILETAKSTEVKIADIFASSDFSRHQDFCGYTVKTPAEIFELYGKSIVIILGFATSRAEILLKVKELSNEVCGELYVPEVPVFGNDIFTPELLNKNMPRIERLYMNLADDASRFTLESLINFKISGKPEYLYRAEADRSEVFKNVLKLGLDEAYVDAGAYNGDTVAEFIAACGGNYKQITAIEPAPINFAKLSDLAAKENYKNTELLNCAVSDKSESRLLSAKGGRSPFLSKAGKVEVKAACLDDILHFEPTYIKYDVEGEELAALIGSRKTIAKYLPKLCVSAYHRNLDFLDIAEYIAELSPKYRLFLRHFQYLPAWETNIYACPLE